MRKKCFCCQATKTPSRLPFLSHPMNAIRITRGTLRRWHCVQVTLFPITTSLAKLSNISFPWIIKREEFTSDLSVGKNKKASDSRDSFIWLKTLHSTIWIQAAFWESSSWSNGTATAASVQPRPLSSTGVFWSQVQPLSLKMQACTFTRFYQHSPNVIQELPHVVGVAKTNNNHRILG